MNDRRRTKRVNVAEPVIIAWDRGDVVGEVRNLSSGGMFIALANAKADAGTKLVVRMGPSHPRPAIEVTCVVRWTNHAGLGVEIARSARDLAE